MDLKSFAWHDVFRETLAAEVTDSVRGHFELTPVNLFATFRVVSPVVTAGSVTIVLRFGFLQAETDSVQATLGVDFPVLNAAQQSFYRSQVWDAGAAAPDTVGNPLSILPPVCAVIASSVAGTNLEYRVQAAYIGAMG